MINITQPTSEEDNTDFIYYLVEGEDPKGNISEADRAAHLINTYLSLQEMAILMGYEVIVMAERKLC